jgi:hypothetical protein
MSYTTDDSYIGSILLLVKLVKYQFTLVDIPRWLPLWPDWVIVQGLPHMRNQHRAFGDNLAVKPHVQQPLLKQALVGHMWVETLIDFDANKIVNDYCSYILVIRMVVMIYIPHVAPQRLFFPHVIYPGRPHKLSPATPSSVQHWNRLS